MDQAAHAQLRRRVHWHGGMMAGLCAQLPVPKIVRVNPGFQVLLVDYRLHWQSAVYCRLQSESAAVR